MIDAGFDVLTSFTPLRRWKVVARRLAISLDALIARGITIAFELALESFSNRRFDARLDLPVDNEYNSIANALDAGALEHHL